MKAAFHYIVKSKRIDFNSSNKINFVEYEQIFENENPIIAREKAFSHYQSIIDVLLQAKGKNYQSDKQTRKEILTFIDTGTSTKIKVVSRVSTSRSLIAVLSLGSQLTRRLSR